MAAKYWVGGTANWDATAGTKWALTSGGAGGQAVPTSADDVFIDNKNAPNWAALTSYALAVIRSPLATANGFYYEVTTAGISGAVEPTWPIIVGNTVTDGTITWTCRKATVSVSAATNCLTLIFTNYIGTFTINNGFTLSVNGTAITLGAGMTYNQTTTGVLSTVGNVATTTITFAGITIPNLTFAKPFNGNAVAISGTTPTVKNLVVSSIGASTLIPLTGTALTVTNSIIVDKQLGGSVPIIFSGAVTLSGTNVLNTGFTVPALSILTIGSNIAVGGTITFAPTSSLIPGTYTVSISYGTTLDSSAVTWYNIFMFNASGVTVTLISDWNISNNLSWTNGGATSFIAAATTKTVTIQGSFTPTTANVTVYLSLNNIILNLIGQGTFAPAYLRGTSGVVNINTSNPTGYVIGSSMFTGANTMILGQGLTFNLVGTSVASAFSGTTLQLRDSTTIDTNRTSVGGSNPIYSAIIIDNSASITTDITCTGNLSFFSYVAASTSNANGAKILFGGNLSTSLIAAGTSTLEFTGSSAATWGGAGSYRNNIIVNKSSAAVVTAASAITWGVANAVLTLNSTVNFSTNSNTFTLSGTPLTINNSSASQFYNMTVSANATLNIN